MPGEEHDQDLIEEALVAGVTGAVCVGTDKEASDQAIDLVVKLRARGDGFSAWATAGLHPHEASAGLEAVQQIADVIDAARVQNPGVIVAVGECGLDYYYEHSARNDQRQVFEAQIELAKSRGLTLVVHTRNAWDDTFELLRSVGVPERTIIHCFTGGPEEATKCLDLGAYLSFSGIVTFKGAPEVREAATMCPPDRLLVETDAPFLAPVPYRGKSNRPAWVAVVGEAVADIRGDDPEMLAASTTQAARAAFDLG
jgi:TatD DNase family protein